MLGFSARFWQQRWQTIRLLSNHQSKRWILSTHWIAGPLLVPVYAVTNGEARPEGERVSAYGYLGNRRVAANIVITIKIPLYRRAKPLLYDALLLAKVWLNCISLILVIWFGVKSSDVWRFLEHFGRFADRG